MIANDFGQLQGYELQGQSEQDKRDQLARQNYFTQQAQDQAAQQHDDAVALNQNAAVQGQANFLAGQRLRQAEFDASIKNEAYKEKSGDNYFQLQKDQLAENRADKAGQVDVAGATEAASLAAAAAAKQETDDAYQAHQDMLAQIRDMAALRTKFDERKDAFVPKTGNPKNNFTDADPKDVYLAGTVNDLWAKANQNAKDIIGKKKVNDNAFHATLQRARNLGFEPDDPNNPSAILHVRTGKKFPLTSKGDSYFDDASPSEKDAIDQFGATLNQQDGQTEDQGGQQEPPVVAPPTVTSNTPNYLYPAPGLPEAPYPTFNGVSADITGKTANPVVPTSPAVAQPAEPIVYPPPKSKSELVDGRIYQTVKGPRRWSDKVGGLIPIAQ